jgi:hypothetical protein
MIGSPWLQGRDRYERVVDGWSDSTHDDAFTHTVRVTDDDFGVELRAVCTPPPSYEVREASARVLSGHVAPEITASAGAICGTRMVGGFTKKLAGAVGSLAGAALFIEAGVEVARLARQVTKLPPEITAGLRPDEALRFWEFDTQGWEDLPDSCFAYTRAGRALFDKRSVATTMQPALYNAPTGATKVFQRKRLVRLVQTGQRLHLFHAMHDNAHGFDLHYEIDLDSGVIVAVDSVRSRLPYLGLCDVPQGKLSSLKGEKLDASLKKRTQSLIGGETGCTQLFVLTSDLLKLLTVS